jgi:hypothetical protein
VEFGIGRRFIAPAIRQLIEVGLIAVSTSVRQGSQRAPNAEAITERRMFAALVRDMKGVVKQIENDE